MRKKLNLTGQKFGRLVVLEYAYMINRRSYWLCKCDCGNEIVVQTVSLRNGHTKSCGCLQKEFIGRLNKTHGESSTLLYGVWKTMRARCNIITCSGYKYYGAKGITVCKKWNNYLNFKDWALENGYKKGLQIDRINPHDNYCSDNCQWITQKENLCKI